jgi:hypothetical protein
MAVIRIKNKDTTGGVPTGLSQGELAVNLSDRSLYVGGTVGNSIFISGVQSFNGATGEVTGVSFGENTFTGLNQFEAGISAAGATLGILIVQNGISANGGATFSGLVHAVSGISASGATLGTLIVHNGISANGGVTLSRFRAGKIGPVEMLIVEPGAVIVNGSFIANDQASILKGISASGATLGTLVVHRGISANGGATFAGFVNVIGGISAAGATLGTLIVHSGISASGGATFNGSISAVSGITTANLYVSTGATFASTLQVNGGFSAASTSTFGGLAYFNSGISASGATIGTLTVHNGISANGGATFSGLVHAVSGISAAGATLGTLIVHNGISASGGITFYNTLYVGGGASFGNSIDVASDISFGGNLKKSGQTVNLISVYGKTADLPRPGLEGEVAFVNGLSAGVSGAGYGLYLWDGGFSFEYEGVRGSWIRITDSEGYRFNQDLNGDGIIDGTDLAFLLAAWGSSGAEYSQGGSQSLLMGIGDGLGNAFEVKVFGTSTGKKASAFKITSDQAEPYVYFQANETNFDSRVIISDSSGEPALHVQTGRSLFSEGVEFQAGFSAGCGVTFNCLPHFTKGLSASGATLGTLVVNGGATFNGPVHMGATLTMNSNIRFNTGYGISGGFIDAGWY